MGEIRFVGTGETRGYPYPVCKKRIVGPGKTRRYPYPVCKKKRVSCNTVANIKDLTRVVISYEIYETSLRFII